MRILNSSRLATNSVRRKLAALALRSLNSEEQAKIIEEFLGSIVTCAEVGDHTLRFTAPTPLLQWRAQTALSKEPDTIRWIDQFRPDDILWDIGANIGVFSIYAAMLRGVGVLAFEPAADNYMFLCRNVAINELFDRVVPYCIAFSGTTALGVLNSHSATIGSALRQFGKRGDVSRYWPTKTGTCAQGMIGFSIDDFVQRFNQGFPSHLKLDVDGLEIDILSGATETIRDPRMRSIMVELSVDDDEERDGATALLTAAGFELASHGEIQESAGARGANHLFVKR